jgi:hypothetical protein
MRTTTLILAAALFIGAPVAAQTTALAVGTGARATVRVQATLNIPVYLRATETATLTQTWKGDGFTEYLAKYTVRGNVRWTLEAVTLPAGVTVLDARGDWVPTLATIGHGDPTNGAELYVRVRVTDGAVAGWAEALQIETVRAF